MIVSASRRTDIPAFYADWFYDKIDKGFLLVRNPMNVHQISRIDIRPSVVDCIVFWTKNPKEFMQRLNLLKKYQFYFQYTITGYGKRLEPNVPSLESSILCFKQLSDIIGAKRVIWRYDPIILTDKHNIKWHILHFKKIADKLAGYTERCVISFVDYYKKTIRNMSHVKYTEINNQQILNIAESLKYIGDRCGIELVSCAEEIDLEKQGIEHGCCIDDKLIEEITGYVLDVEKDKNQRIECGCIASIDIGAYNTCPHGCIYCYANYDLNKVRSNYSLHDSSSNLLYGNVAPNDRIKDRKVLSCRVVQSAIFEKED